MIAIVVAEPGKKFVAPTVMYRKVQMLPNNAYLNMIIRGECLKIMTGMPSDSIDCLITDPPYSSGGQFRGDRIQGPSKKYVQTDSIDTCRNEFAGDNRDQRAFLLWATMWMSEAFRVTKPGGIALVFTDWRQLPTITDAVQCGGWIWRNIVTWWKPGCRMQRGRFSSSAEYVIYASRGIPMDGERSPQNVLSFQGVNGSEKSHIAEKPIELMRALLGVTRSDSIILDPFCGSGTTLVAAKQLGRKYIGIEINPDYCKIAEERLRQEELFATPEVTCGK